MLDDPRLAAWCQRKETEAALRAVIEDARVAEDAKSRKLRRNDADDPCTSRGGIEAVIDHPQIVARRAIEDAATPQGEMRLMGSRFQMAQGGGQLETLPPAPGAHTAEVR